MKNLYWYVGIFVGVLGLVIVFNLAFNNQDEAYVRANGSVDNNSIIVNQSNDENSGRYSGMGSMMGGSTFGGMMGGTYDETEYSGELLSEEVLTERVERYISRIDESLVLSDLFKYSNSDYYVSVKEEDTGMGAFELLINPFTGSIQLEQGPNMMWNEKYSKMSSMHGSFSSNNFDIQSMISIEEAVDAANKYLAQKGENLTATTDGHKFYGYYTLHVEKDGNPYGMLSVNGSTGNVWYHTWHGELEEIEELGEH